MSVGERIKYYRVEAGLSQADLDRKAIVGLDFLSKLENNKIPNIRMSKLLRLSKALNLSLEKIAG
ncbi:MAG: helix-turn-helix domain-containing protein [Clostridium paraputrificum]